jgi:S1-C subfamily serine protease
VKNFVSLFGCGLFLFLVGCCVGPVKGVQPPVLNHNRYRSEQIENVRRLKNLTVALTDLDSRNQLIRCSAMWVKQGFLLTAGHCINSQKLITYETLDDDEGVHLAIVKAVDEINDLALLIVDPSSEPIHDNVIFTDEIIESGEEAHIVGHTAGYGWTYSKGYVSAIRREMKGPLEAPVEKVVQISSPAWMGNSGGGAFDSGGHFIGICSWVSTSGPFLTFFIHKDVISKFLAKEEVIY